MEVSTGVMVPEEFKKIVSECMALLRTKGDDYTEGRGSKDRLYNFRSAAEAAGVSIEQAWYIYFYKHYTSLVKYIKDGKVESEPIRERVKDLINYLILFSLIVESKSSEGRPFHAPDKTYSEILKNAK